MRRDVFAVEREKISYSFTYYKKEFFEIEYQNKP